MTLFRLALISLACLIGVTTAWPATVRILFIGNSLVAVNDVPGMVKALIESDGSGRQVVVKMIFAPHLNDIASDRRTQEEIRYGNWDFVVLQGAMVSMSHQYDYPQDGGIQLAKMAVVSGAKTFLYSEWSRRGIDETAYTEDVYKGIAKASGAKVIPVGRIWDEMMRQDGGLDLLQADGNHAAPGGSFIAAEAVYAWVCGQQVGSPTWRLRGINNTFAKTAFNVSRGFWLKANT